MNYEAQHHLLLLVKHNLYLLLAPPEQGAFQVRDSEATKTNEGRGKGGKGMTKMVRIIKTQYMMTIRTTTHDSLVQLFGLCHYSSCSSIKMSIGGCSWPPIKLSIVVSAVQCYHVHEEAADPTWVQSTIATRYGMLWYFIVDHMVYMGTVSNT